MGRPKEIITLLQRQERYTDQLNHTNTLIDKWYKDNNINVGSLIITEPYNYKNMLIKVILES